jgi:hypothetical protein
VILLAAVAVAAAALAIRGVAPLPVALVHAHAHNDYDHPRPLLDALDHGFCSIEVDVWLVDGRLLVAHDRDAVDSRRTLESLYLDPLRERVRANGGRLYPLGPECDLLVDVKSDAAVTYAVLREVLERYADILTSERAGVIEHRAMLAIISGNEAPALVKADPVRYAALDGRLEDLHSPETADLVPWISADWERTFSWRGSGPLPDADERLLRAIVAGAHASGRKARFWNAPDNESGWRVLWDAGVDLINTDDLTGLERFLLPRALLPLRS